MAADTSGIEAQSLLAPNRPEPGEVRLLRAVLVEAANVVAIRGGRLRADAVAWIASDQRSYIFDFVNVCEALNLDPSAVRAALLDGRHLGRYGISPVRHAYHNTRRSPME